MSHFLSFLAPLVQQRGCFDFEKSNTIQKEHLIVLDGLILFAGGTTAAGLTEILLDELKKMKLKHRVGHFTSAGQLLLLLKDDHPK